MSKKIIIKKEKEEEKRVDLSEEICKVKEQYKPLNPTMTKTNISTAILNDEDYFELLEENHRFDDGFSRIHK